MNSLISRRGTPQSYELKLQLHANQVSNPYEFEIDKNYKTDSFLFSGYKNITLGFDHPNDKVYDGEVFALEGSFNLLYNYYVDNNESEDIALTENNINNIIEYFSNNLIVKAYKNNEEIDNFSYNITFYPDNYEDDGGSLYIYGYFNITINDEWVANYKYEIVNKNNNQVFDNRSYKITPRQITITTAPASKPYDGTPLTNSNCSITSGSLVYPDDVLYKAVGSQTAVGSSTNYCEVIVKYPELYDITIIEGTLTVMQPPVIGPDLDDPETSTP